MPEQKFDDMSWWEKMDLMRKLAGYPASSLLLFSRTNLGYRFIKPIWFLMLAVALLIASVVMPQASEPYPAALRLYALALIITFPILRWKRWQEIRNWVRWHSYSPGISFLERLRFWPPFMWENRRINRFVEPIFFDVIGLLVAAFICRLLGSWIIVASAFVFVYEQDMFEKNTDSALDALDGMLNSDVHAENVKHFSQPQPEERARQLTETAGIPTGLAPDIHRQVELRKAQRKAALDNSAETAA